MKKICRIACIFILFFIAFTITSCKKETEDISEKDDIVISGERDIQLSPSIVSLDINGGSLFYIINAQIIECSMSSGEETVIMNDLTGAESIYVISGRIYIYDSIKNCVLEYDGQYKIINEYILSEQIGVVEKLIKFGDTILILHGEQDRSYANKIYKIDTKNNTQGNLDLQRGEMYINDILFMDEESILIIHFNIAGAAQLTKYNLAKEKKEFTIDDIRTPNVYNDMKRG